MLLFATEQFILVSEFPMNCEKCIDPFHIQSIPNEYTRSICTLAKNEWKEWICRIRRSRRWSTIFSPSFDLGRLAINRVFIVSNSKYDYHNSTKLAVSDLLINYLNSLSQNMKFDLYRGKARTCIYMRTWMSVNGELISQTLAPLHSTKAWLILLNRSVRSISIEALLPLL